MTIDATIGAVGGLQDDLGAAPQVQAQPGRAGNHHPAGRPEHEQDGDETPPEVTRQCEEPPASAHADEERRGAAVRPAGGRAAPAPHPGRAGPETRPWPLRTEAVPRRPRTQPQVRRQGRRAAPAPAARSAPVAGPGAAAPGHDPAARPAPNLAMRGSRPTGPRRRPQPRRRAHPPTATQAPWRAPGTPWWPRAAAASAWRSDRTGSSGKRQGRPATRRRLPRRLTGAAEQDRNLGSVSG